MKHAKDKAEDLKKFLEGRFVQFMSVFVRALGPNKFMFGNKVSQADLVVYEMLRSYRYNFGDDAYDTYIAKKFPSLESLVGRIGERERVKKCYDDFYKSGGKDYGEKEIIGKSLAAKE